MTVRSFGQVMPLQGFMLMLAGYGHSIDDDSPDLVLATDQNQYVENICAGYSELRLLWPDLAERLGVSLVDWRDEILKTEHLAKKYKFGVGWRDFDKCICAQIRMKDRSFLENKAYEIIGVLD